MKLRNTFLYMILMGLAAGLATAALRANEFEHAWDYVAKTSSTVADRAIEIVKPMAKAVKTQALAALHSPVVGALKSTVLFPVNHPIITTTAGLSAVAAYLKYCHNSTDWNSVITDAQLITRYMVNPVNKPAKLMYWKNESKPGNWATAADIMADSTKVYKALKNEYWTTDTTEYGLFERMKGLIENEKKELVGTASIPGVLPKLENCLAGCTILPSLELAPDQAAAKPNIVKTIIEKKMRNFGYASNDDFIRLTKPELLSINCDISRRAHPLFVNPYAQVRHYALPFEAAAVREYWRVFQLSKRLEALRACLDQRVQELQKPEETPGYNAFSDTLGYEVLTAK